MSIDKAGKVVFVDLPKAMQGKHVYVKLGIAAVITVAAVGLGGYWVVKKIKGT